MGVYDPQQALLSQIQNNCCCSDVTGRRVLCAGNDPGLHPSPRNSVTGAVLWARTILGSLHFCGPAEGTPLSLQKGKKKKE